ncbi:MAG: HAD family hydrolase [Defluviitaleaceae bacterium]|nr:HAD family hydrolase [Defluviitaleaceae bacterium]
MFKAVMFDLDDTLLDRSKAADAMFSIIARECYSNKATDEMLQSFRKYDNNGYSSKVTALNRLFDDFRPDYRIPSTEIYAFWGAHFSDCFLMDETALATIKIIVSSVKTAIITNGSSQMQRAKIEKTGLDKIFDVILISDDVGAKKPDLRIFEMAIQKLGIQPKEALFVGDNLANDVGGSQKAGMNGVWFNPNRLRNDTDVVPFKEIACFSEILPLVS